MRNFLLPLSLFLAASAAHATTLTYTPSFSSPGSLYFYPAMNANGLLSKKSPRQDSSLLSSRSLGQVVQDTVALSLSSQITGRLLAASPSSGTFDLGDGSTISYSTDGSTRIITFTKVTGEITTIRVPLI